MLKIKDMMNQMGKTIANKLNLDHEVHYFDDELIKSKLDEYVKSMDEPLGDSSMLPTMLVSEIVAKEFKVVLSADGGDEMAMGYQSITQLRKFKRSKNYNRYIKFFNKKLVKYIANLFTKGNQIRFIY